MQGYILEVDCLACVIHHRTTRDGVVCPSRWMSENVSVDCLVDLPAGISLKIERAFRVGAIVFVWATSREG